MLLRLIVEVVRFSVDELVMSVHVGDLLRVLILEALVLTVVHSGMGHCLIVLIAHCDLVELVEKIVVVGHKIVIGMCVNGLILDL